MNGKLENTSWHSYRFQFPFPYWYPLSDNTWHMVALTHKWPALTFYLDGCQRHEPRNTVAKKVDLTAGVWRLGYHKGSQGAEYFFNGSISHFDVSTAFTNLNGIALQSSQCVPKKRGISSSHWNGLHLALRMDPCHTRGNKYCHFNPSQPLKP